MVSSPNSTVSSQSRKRSDREENDGERGASSSLEIDDGGGDMSGRNNLHLSKEQAATLEETFKEKNKLNQNQKMAFSYKKEEAMVSCLDKWRCTWFQNRRARPKVGREEAHGADDVQRLFLVLRPESGERPVEEKQDPHSGKEGAEQHVSPQTDQEPGPKDAEGGGGRGSAEVNIEERPLLRFVVMGRKSLPDAAEKSRPYWGFVEMITTDVGHVKAALKGGEYDTATRGHRHQPDCRAAGEGVYRLLRHNPGSSKMHTHLVYKLEFPREGEEEEPQEALNIAREASFLVQIKNPDQHAGSQFRGLRSKRKAAFPAHLQGLFGHRRYAPADPPDFLNYEGCEFLLIAASDHIEEELGLELKAEEAPQRDGGGSAAECSDLVKTFGEDAASTRPLFQGTWE